MTRTEAIELITATLAALDDEGVLAVADMVKSLAADDDLPRELTPEELALIERSKEDFKAGRTLTLEEAEARTEAFLAERLRLRRTS